MKPKEALLKIVKKVGTQAKLAELLGVNETYVSSMINERYKVSHKLVRKLILLSEGEITESDLRPDLFYDYTPQEKKEHSCYMVA